MYGALVGLVQHDHCVLREVVVHQALPQQHPVRHVLDDCLRARAVLEANGVANLQGRGRGEEERGGWGGWGGEGREGGEARNVRKTEEEREEGWGQQEVKKRQDSSGEREGTQEREEEQKSRMR